MQLVLRTSTQVAAGLFIGPFSSALRLCPPSWGYAHLLGLTLRYHGFKLKSRRIEGPVENFCDYLELGRKTLRHDYLGEKL